MTRRSAFARLVAFFGLATGASAVSAVERPFHSYAARRTLFGPKHPLLSHIVAVDKEYDIELIIDVGEWLRMCREGTAHTRYEQRGQLFIMADEHVTGPPTSRRVYGAPHEMAESVR